MSTTIIENVVADGQWAERTIIHHGSSENYVVSSYKDRPVTNQSKLTELFKHVTPKGII